MENMEHMDHTEQTEHEQRERRARAEKMDRIKKVLWNIVVPVVLVIALAVVSFWGMEQKTRAAGFENTTRNMYYRCYVELADNITDMSVILEKVAVVNSPRQYVLLLDDLWRLSGSSEGLLSQLPTSHVDTQALNRFLVQAGDFARSLTKRVLSGGPISEEDMKQLEALYGSSVQLSAMLGERIQNNQLPMVSLSGEEYYTQAAEGEGWTEDQEGSQELPTLIYDGPFSESTSKAEPKGLTEGKISAEDAKKLAEQYLGLPVESRGDSNGVIPSYDFTAVDQNQREIDISITQAGGKLLTFMSYVTGNAQGKGDEAESEKLRQAAEKRLKELGFENMEANYAQYYDGCAVINFAAIQNDVILYSDLVKVWVDRDTLQVIGMDARNYWMSHVERNIPTEGLVSEDEAKGMLSSNLEVKSVRLALIPLTVNTEKLCYEFKGVYRETSYIVYINAQDLTEEQVFKIIDSDSGQLVL